MRLYVLDLPEGMSARILAIAIRRSDSDFERVVKAAAPVLDSIEFHAPYVKASFLAWDGG